MGLFASVAVLVMTLVIVIIFIIVIMVVINISKQSPSDQVQGNNTQEHEGRKVSGTRQLPTRQQERESQEKELNNEATPTQQLPWGCHRGRVGGDISGTCVEIPIKNHSIDQPTKVSPIDIKNDDDTSTTSNVLSQDCISPKEVSPTEVSPTEVSPTEVSPTEVSPKGAFVEVSPKGAFVEVSPKGAFVEVSPKGAFSGDISSKQISPESIGDELGKNIHLVNGRKSENLSMNNVSLTTSSSEHRNKGKSCYSSRGQQSNNLPKDEDIKVPGDSRAGNNPSTNSGEKGNRIGENKSSFHKEISNSIYRVTGEPHHQEKESLDFPFVRREQVSNISHTPSHTYSVNIGNKRGDHTPITPDIATTPEARHSSHTPITPDKQGIERGIVSPIHNTRVGRVVYNEILSEDDEQNSGEDIGDREGKIGNREGEIDLRREGNNYTTAFNQETRDKRRSATGAIITSPYEKRGESYYCHKKEKKSPVVDVCSYSNTTIFLLDNGEIIREMDEDPKKRQRVTNNVSLKRITSFSGYLCGVGVDHRLYKLSNDYFSTGNWLWDSMMEHLGGIIHFSSTHDGEHLWVQTTERGYLCSALEKVTLEVSFSDGTTRRVYGKDSQHYIDINTSNFTATVHPGRNIINNIHDAAMSYYDDIISISVSEKSKYSRIVVVNWKPYYIKA